MNAARFRQTFGRMSLVEQRVVLAHVIEEHDFAVIGQDEGISDKWAQLVYASCLEQLRAALAL